METHHATYIDINGNGVLLRGPGGAGKSDLALRLINDGAKLVADDQVVLTERDGAWFANPPDALAGLLEVRGLGVIRMDHARDVRLALIVDLVPGGPIERHPDSTLDAGLGVALVRLDPFEASAAAKVRFSLSLVLGSIIKVP